MASNADIATNVAGTKLNLLFSLTLKVNALDQGAPLEPPSGQGVGNFRDSLRGSEWFVNPICGGQMIHKLIATRRAHPAEFRFVNNMPRYVVSAFKLVVAGMKSPEARLAPAGFSRMIVAANPSRRRSMPASMRKPANDI